MMDEAGEMKDKRERLEEKEQVEGKSWRGRCNMKQSKKGEIQYARKEWLLDCTEKDEMERKKIE